DHAKYCEDRHKRQRIFHNRHLSFAPVRKRSRTRPPGNSNGGTGFQALFHTTGVWNNVFCYQALFSTQLATSTAPLCLAPLCLAPKAQQSLGVWGSAPGIHGTAK